MDPTARKPVGHPPQQQNDNLEELVGNNPSERNWRGIGIALLVILVVCALVITAVVLLTPGDGGSSIKGERLQLSDILDSSFKYKTFQATWLKDNIYIHRDNDGALVKVNVEDDDDKDILLSNATFRRRATSSFQVSPKANFILVPYDFKKVFRHTTLAKYEIYSPVDTRIGHLTPYKTEVESRYLQFADWGPVDENLVFVYENNIFYQANPHENPVRITNDASKDIYNGIPDWVYEEEILSSGSAIWWSKDGSYICYAKFVDTEVSLYKYPVYGDKSNLYPVTEEVHYPKVGQVNPKASLYVVDLKNTNPVTPILLEPPDLIKGHDHYFTAVSWSDNQHVAIIWMNRTQNLAIISICDATTGKCSNNYKVSDNKGWVDLYNPPNFLVNNASYYLILPHNDGNKGEFRQVASISASEEAEAMFLTHNTWDVTSIAGYDQAEHYLYFIGTGPNPGHRHLYRVTESGVTSQHTVTCITCSNEEHACQYHNALFNPNGKWYILFCEGPDPPVITLHKTSEKNPVRVLEDNKSYKEFLSTKALPEIRHMTVSLPEMEVPIMIYIPPGFRPNDEKKYPLLIDVYGGPNSQNVDYKFKILYGTFLCSRHSIMYGFIDGRGSGYKGDEILHKIYKHLGDPEVIDQIDATKELIKKFPYIDYKRVGIWGWSYGGFVTAHVLGNENGAKVFKCGCAVAPVTDFRYYDSVYTERYMGLVETNPTNYAAASLLEKAKKFNNTNLLLIHGTGDDNVHFQHTAQFIKALSEAEVSFKMQIYTDEAHGISGSRKHLYSLLTQFFLDCFKEEVIEEVGLQSTQKA